MRKFNMIRLKDKTGISGTGTVAEGVEFSDGTAVMRWLPSSTSRASNGVKPTTVFHDSVESVVALHGHGRSTYVQFEDGERLYQLQVPAQRQEQKQEA